MCNERCKTRTACRPQLTRSYTETGCRCFEVDPNGLWCEAGGFYIDPWGPVPKALITHGHSDHARRGSDAYLCSLSLRAGPARAPRRRMRCIETVTYGETRRIGDVAVSFHPAGHVLGSAQIRVEHRGEVWVVSGDYKLAPDPTCTPFEPVRCHTFVTESTFGLPIYRWPPQSEILASINEWWRANQERGKVQRALRAIRWASRSACWPGSIPTIGPIFCHGAVERMNRVYRASGVGLPATLYPGDVPQGYDWTQALVIAPPSAQGSPWMKRFGAVSTASSRAGCAFAERAGADRSIAASCSPITPTGPVCRQAIQRNRRRMRSGDARLSRARWCAGCRNRASRPRRSKRASKASRTKRADDRNRAAE